MESYIYQRRKGLPNGCVVFRHRSGQTFSAALTLWRNGADDTTIVADFGRSADAGSRLTLVFGRETVTGSLSFESASVPAENGVVAYVIGRRIGDVEPNRCAEAYAALADSS